MEVRPASVGCLAKAAKDCSSRKIGDLTHDCRNGHWLHPCGDLPGRHRARYYAGEDLRAVFAARIWPGPSAQGSNLENKSVDPEKDCKGQSCVLCEMAESGTGGSANREVQTQKRHVEREGVEFFCFWLTAFWNRSNSSVSTCRQHRYKSTCFPTSSNC